MNKPIAAGGLGHHPLPKGRRHSVLIADDHEALRRGVRVTLEGCGFQVVGECADGREAVEAAMRLRPELCLLDVQMPFGGVRAAEEIHRQLPGTKIVMLTVSDETSDFLAAVRAGASAYLLKSIDPERLPLALLKILHGEASFPRTLVPYLVEDFRNAGHSAVDSSPPHRLSGLTRRESEVLELLAGGYSTAQIAARLAIAEVTVRSHIATMMHKLEVADRGEAIRKLHGAEQAAGPVEVLNGRPQ